MSEQREASQQRVEPENTFRQSKIRIEKANRIADDLKPLDGGNYDRSRVDEVRDIEMQSQQGEAGKQSGYEEMPVVLTGFQEKRIVMHHTNEQTGEEIAEELVLFGRLDSKGQSEWLQTSEGNLLAINARLYDSRIRSQKHPGAFTVPRIDGRGAYTGIYSIMGSTENNASDLTQHETSVSIPEQTPVELFRQQVAQAIAGEISQADLQNASEQAVKNGISRDIIIAELRAARIAVNETTAQVTPKTEQQKKVDDIQGAFAGMAQGIIEGALAKRDEYEERIKAALRGQEQKRGDIQYINQLKADYLRLGGSSFWDNQS